MGEGIGESKTPYLKHAGTVLQAEMPGQLSVVPASTMRQRHNGLNCGNCSLDGGLM